MAQHVGVDLKRGVGFLPCGLHQPQVRFCWHYRLLSFQSARILVIIRAVCNRILGSFGASGIGRSLCARQVHSGYHLLGATMHHEISRSSSLLARASKCAIIAAVAVCTAAAAAPLRPNDAETTTAIKHVIVIIGENRSFDHIFAAYKPRPGQTVLNLLSEGIIKEDGTPGPNFSKAAQNQAQVTLNYESAPAQKKAYATLPPEPALVYGLTT